VTITLALAGDTMLGRGTAKALDRRHPRTLVSEEIAEVAAEADFFLLNLECCISERGEPWPDAHKPFFFRAPPVAVETLTYLGVDCVTLANNHALDFGYIALEDTLHYLGESGIACVGAGLELEQARASALRLQWKAPDSDECHRSSSRLRRDHQPTGRGAGGPSQRLTGMAPRCDRSPPEDIVLVSPHWGPNMVAEPLPSILAAGRSLIEAGATLVAGHSAHVFHGMNSPVLYVKGALIGITRPTRARRATLRAGSAVLTLTRPD
jgi:poly-gamma-glutamate capsule biosynthesis protein CapA/YwtB (metallophosphatase superfamily)